MISPVLGDDYAIDEKHRTDLKEFWRNWNGDKALPYDEWCDPENMKKHEGEMTTQFPMIDDSKWAIDK